MQSKHGATGMDAIKIRRMKSIKEKSEELVEKRIELSREESIVYFQGIEDGANYVLECIEEATNIYFDKGLRKIIEQLKK